MPGMTVTDADVTIAELPLDAIGHVPWWPPEANDVTLHQVPVHVAADTCRPAGHAGTTRELIDGAVGLTAPNSNLSSGDEEWWSSYRATRSIAQPAKPLVTLLRAD